MNTAAKLTTDESPMPAAASAAVAQSKQSARSPQSRQRRAPTRHEPGAARRACERRVGARVVRARLRAVGPWMAENYWRAVAFASVRVGQDAEDMVLDAWIRAQARFAPREGPFPRFFWAVLRGVIADRFRKAARTPASEPLDEAALLDFPATEDGADPERTENLRIILRRLPRGLVILLLKHEASDLPLKGLASKFKLTLGGLKMRLKRARRLLAAILRAAGCHRTAAVAALGERARHRPVVLALPPPARKQPRPSCRSPKTPLA